MHKTAVSVQDWTEPASTLAIALAPSGMIALATDLAVRNELFGEAASGHRAKIPAYMEPL